LKKKESKTVVRRGGEVVGEGDSLPGEKDLLFQHHKLGVMWTVDDWNKEEQSMHDESQS